MAKVETETSKIAETKPGQAFKQDRMPVEVKPEDVTIGPSTAKEGEPIGTEAVGRLSVQGMSGGSVNVKVASGSGAAILQGLSKSNLWRTLYSVSECGANVKINPPEKADPQNEFLGFRLLEETGRIKV